MKDKLHVSGISGVMKDQEILRGLLQMMNLFDNFLGFPRPDLNLKSWLSKGGFMAEPVKEFTRQELEQLRTRALICARDYVANESWKRAYLDLAHACNVLDAFMARSTVKED